MNFPGSSERPSWVNPGLSLRWACALSTLEQHAALPASAVEQLTAAWVDHVRGLLRASSPYVACLEEKGEDGGAAGAAMPGGVCSIISFVLYKPNWCVCGFYFFANSSDKLSSDDSYGQIKPFSFEETKELYIEMTKGML